MRRLKTVRRPPIYPKTPGHLPCSSLTHPLPLSSRRPSVSFGGFGFILTGINVAPSPSASSFDLTKGWALLQPLPEGSAEYLNDFCNSSLNLPAPRGIYKTQNPVLVYVVRANLGRIALYYGLPCGFQLRNRPFSVKLELESWPRRKQEPDLSQFFSRRFACADSPAESRARFGGMVPSPPAWMSDQDFDEAAVQASQVRYGRKKALYALAASFAFLASSTTRSVMCGGTFS